MKSVWKTASPKGALPRLLSALALALAGACEKGASEPIENATPSPNASILPAPLSSVVQPAAESPWTAAGASSGLPNEPGTKAIFGDAGFTVPEVLRADRPVDDDTLSQREVLGVSLEGEWRYGDLTGTARPAEANPQGLDVARRATALRMRIDMGAPGRMRVLVQSRAMPIEQGTEVRARADHYGHVLLWPSGSSYRVLPPGALRTLLGEGRADANPLVRPLTSVVGDGTKRAGHRTRKWELTTGTGKLVLEQARMVAAGDGGPLFCRFLAEIVAIDPSAAPCATDDVPLRAQYTWPGGGSIAFEITAVVEKVELPVGQLLVPPAVAQFTQGGLPARGTSVLLTREELNALRLRPAEPAAALTLEDGLLLHNGVDVLRYAFFDGVPVAVVNANRDLAIAGLPRGRYLVQWRTFLADNVEPPTLQVPSPLGAAPVPVGRDR